MSSVEGQVAFCRKCGVTGYAEALIYCNLCRVTAEHLYCFDKMPEDDEEIIWSCEDCLSTASLNKPMLQPIQKGEQRKDKQPQENPNFGDVSKKILPNSSMEYRNSAHGLPVEDPVWRGHFKIRDQVHGTIAAHLSSKTCSKVHEVAIAMPTMIHLELQSRRAIWPKRFDISAPTDSDIALYFFEERNTKIFDELMAEMTDRDCALKAVIGNTELLIFHSDRLSHPYWRYNGKFYLWGVYKEKRVSVTSFKVL